MCAQSLQRGIDIFLRNDGEQFAFVRHIKRIQSENFARAFYFFVYWDRCFIEEHADFCRLRDLGERAGYAATSGIAQDVNVDPVSKNRSDQSSCSGALSLAISVSNSNPSRTDMIAMPCTAIGPLIMILSPTVARAGWMFTPFGTTPMPEVLMKILSALPAINHLRITSDKLHAGGIGRSVHRLDDAPEIFHRQSFFQDKAGREIKRARSAHREIVHRSVDGEFSDVAAGKKDRTDHERIGAERDAFAVQRKNCAVVEWLEQFVAKLRQHHLFDQLVTQFSAAAVSEDNLLVIGDRQRTGSAENEDRRRSIVIQLVIQMTSSAPSAMWIKSQSTCTSVACTS